MAKTRPWLSSRNEWKAGKKGRPPSEFQLSKEDQQARRKLSKIKSKAKKGNSKWELKDEEALAILKAGVCHYCCLNRKTDVLSQKITSKEYISGNVVPSCKPCNRARGRECYEVFIAYRDASALAVVARYQG